MPARTQELDADEVIRRVENVMRGDTVQYKAAMTITRPRWTRTVELRSWDDGANDRSLIRILAPARDRGTGFLKVEKTLWTFLPRVERTIRMPPSMLLQSWMGSDFTNDDLVRESSLVDDYSARLIGERDDDLQPTEIGVELIAHEDAAAVWSKIDFWVEKARLAPVEQIFYGPSENGDTPYEALRRMRFSDIREVQGRPMPHHWLMEVLDEPGNSTAFTLEEIRYDEPMPDRLFTLTELKRAEAVK